MFQSYGQLRWQFSRDEFGGGEKFNERDQLLNF